jgi:hypothetical protein
MQFYTQDECEAWLSERRRQKPDLVPDIHVVRIAYPSEHHRLYRIARFIASSLTHRMKALLWIKEWGMWSSSENWHLYYKLRQAYGDQRSLHDAPGHLCLEHEGESLASFLQIAMLNGWSGYVLTEANHVNAFFSHESYIDFYAEHDENLAEIRNALGAEEPAAS